MVLNIKCNSRYLNRLGLVWWNTDLPVTVGDSKSMLLAASPSHLYREQVEGGGACIVHLEGLSQHQRLHK